MTRSRDIRAGHRPLKCASMRRMVYRDITDSDLMLLVGSSLHDARKQAGLTRVNLASQLGISAKHVQRCELIGVERLSLVAAWCRACCVDATRLIGDALGRVELLADGSGVDRG